MAEDVLVASSIQDGYDFLRALAQAKFNVTAAWWINPVDSPEWQFCVASPVVDQEGPAAAYRTFVPILRSLHKGDGVLAHLAAKAIRAVGADDPSTKDILAILRNHAGGNFFGLNGLSVGGVDAHAIYIYPADISAQGAKLPTSRRKLRSAVEQIVPASELLTPLSDEEAVARNRVIASGIVPEVADLWIRKRRYPERQKHPIPAGTVVEAWPVGWVGDDPGKDPNPLLRVRAADGAEGLIYMENTDPIGGA